MEKEIIPQAVCWPTDVRFRVKDLNKQLSESLLDFYALQSELEELMREATKHIGALLVDNSIENKTNALNFLNTLK